MKKIICIVLVILPVFYIYSDSIKKYEPEFIYQVKNGRENGQIWYDKYGLPHHTQTFTISKNENVYVCDPYNKRINVYDIFFNFIKNITNKEFAPDRVAFADKVIVDNSENLIILNHTKGLYRYANDGTRLLMIPSDELPDSVLYSMHYYPFNENIVFFDVDGNLCLIDKNGNISTSQCDESNIVELRKSEDTIENRIYSYIKENGMFYYNEKIFPKDYDAFNSLRTDVKKEINKSQQESEETKNNILIESDMFINQFIIGYDNDNNIYWQGYWHNYSIRAIVIFSKDLALLDLFTYKLPGDEDTYEAVAPNGDIYIMQPEPDGVYFYKITRRW